jgi:hypothetical protein
MEIQDGFVVGVYSYCDRWCRTCALTSRCRLFADMAEMEASLDPGLKPVVEAPPLPQDQPEPPPRWMLEVIDDMNEAIRNPPTPEEMQLLDPPIAPEHLPLSKLAGSYGSKAMTWLERDATSFKDEPDDPRAVIAHYCLTIGAKVYRALKGLAAGWEHDGPGDHDGSAKVALIGLDHSLAAWAALQETGVVSATDAAELLGDLNAIRDGLERALPRARAFVRAGFDEPDALAKLASEQCD